MKKSGCFLGNGPHRAKECPSKRKINALIAAVTEEADHEGPA